MLSFFFVLLISTVFCEEYDKDLFTIFSTIEELIDILPSLEDSLITVNQECEQQSPDIGTMKQAAKKLIHGTVLETAKIGTSNQVIFSTPNAIAFAVSQALVLAFDRHGLLFDDCYTAAVKQQVDVYNKFHYDITFDYFVAYDYTQDFDNDAMNVANNNKENDNGDENGEENFEINGVVEAMFEDSHCLFSVVDALVLSAQVCVDKGIIVQGKNIQVSREDGMLAAV